MKRFIKGYNLKVFIVTLSIAFLFTATVYSGSFSSKASNDFLRVPSIFQDKERAENIASLYQTTPREDISNAKTVLLVDDKIWVILMVSQLFKNHGFNVIPARSSEEALKLFKSNNIDVIVSDVNLPGMNGDKFVRKIREKNNLPMFLITASGEQDIVKLQKEVLDLGIPVFDKLDLGNLVNGIVAVIFEGNNRVLPSDVGGLKKLMNNL
jgi:two-component system chemotaxis response regulator CheY